MSKRVLDSTQPNYTDSFEKIMQDHVAATPTKKKRNTDFTQDTIDFTTTFKPLNVKKTEIKMKSIESKVIVIPKSRDYSLNALFRSFFDDEFLDELIEYNSKGKKLQDLPPIFSKKENTRAYPNIQQSKRNFVLQFYALKLFILSKPEPTLRENFKSGASIEVPNYEAYSMSYTIFEKMNVHFTIPIELIESLNIRLTQAINHTGRILCFDEKHKACQDNHYHARWAKGKYGHWISESSILGPKTGLPYIVRLMPTTSVDNRNYENEPYNNKLVSELIEDAYNNVSQESILVADGYYPDRMGRKYCRENNKLYLFKVSKKRFADLFVEAKKHINENNRDDFVVLYSEETKEHFMFYISYQKSKVKQKGILTNAFENVVAPKKYTAPNTIKIAYRTYFNFNDRFNHYLSDRYWPYKRNHWQANYDDFFFAVVQMNVFVLYHEFNEKKLERREFSKNLSEEIFQSLH
jgi:hypothetical protein